MALYLGGAKIAGAGGGGGNANIISCSSYEDYMAKAPHDPKTIYVTPDNGGIGGTFVPLSAFEALSADVYGKLSSIVD